jgi:hypothetical protein
MLGALLSQVKGVFGKAYLYAGLVPAAVVVFGWALFRGGRRGLEEVTTDLFVGAKGGGGGPLVRALVLLSLGLLLFAIRQSLVTMLQTLPLPRIRQRLVARQTQRRQQAQQELEEALTRRTAAGWPQRNFAKPFVHPTIAVPSPAAAITASRGARDVFAQCLAPVPSTSVDVRKAGKILDGLTAILTIGGQSQNLPHGVRSEIADWRNLVETHGAERILAALALEADRCFVRSRRKLDRWPAEEWIEPTALGNRQAALDDYAQARYGIDTGSLWVRLAGVLEPPERREVSDAELSVEVMVNLCVSLFALALGTATVTTFDSLKAIGAGHVVPDWTAVWFILLPLVLAWAAYAGAVYAHRGMALRVIRLVDLRRLRLLQALGYRVTTVEEEVRLFNELRGFFSAATPRSPSRPVFMLEPPQDA